MKLTLLESAEVSTIRISNSYSFNVTGMTFNNSAGLKRFGFYKGYSAKVIVIEYYIWDISMVN